MARSGESFITLGVIPARDDDLPTCTLKGGEAGAEAGFRV
jgi:hypothetical protein